MQVREMGHKASKTSSAFGLCRWRCEILGPPKCSGSNALFDMLTVNKERSQGPANRHAKTPHGLNAASRKARGFNLTVTVKGLLVAYLINHRYCIAVGK